MKTTKLFPVSVVISAYNEELKIADCLRSVNWADEVIVIDNTSIDKTAEIAKREGAKVFLRQNHIMLNINKNFGFAKARNDWILSLDADERVTPELRDEIISHLSLPEADGPLAQARNPQLPNGFWIPRKNIIFGKWISHSIWWPDYQLRLFRKSEGRFPEKDVHEMIEISGIIKKLENPLIHYNYETVSQYIRKMDSIYTENEAKNIIESNTNLAWHDAIKMPVQDFLKTFFMQKGYKDGLHGFVLSLMQAFYAEVVFMKVWEKKGFKDYNSENFLHEFINEGTKLAAEFRYWVLSAFIENTKHTGKKLYYRFLRKRVNKKIKSY